MASKRKRNRRSSALSTLLVLLVALAALVYHQFFAPPPPQTEPAPPVEGQLVLHVIDVGQGDAILLTAPEGNVLIDAGDNVKRYEQALAAYLDEAGVKELDYFVMTHVHADHIGGADMILTDYEVKNVIMTDDVAASGVFNAMLDALEQSQANVIQATPGQTFSLGDLHLNVLGPLDDYSNTNDNSIVLRATYGSVAMMFTGDAEGNAEGEAERDLLAKYSAAELQSDFYKAGHHGSDTSSSKAFLQAVSPKVVAISVGEGNSYGHPVPSIVRDLEATGAKVYRTDLDGTLVFVCNGESIEYRK